MKSLIAIQSTLSQYKRHLMVFSVAVFCLWLGVLLLNRPSFAEQPPSAVNNKTIENYLMGKFNPAKHPAFVKVPAKYASRKGFYLRKATLEAFAKMHQAAKKEGVNLVIRSATRNFNYQKSIWERKWKKQRKKHPQAKARALAILNFSAMPGTSRHHWGTEVDLNSFNNAWFEQGKGLKLFNWLNANAHKYGFYRPYTAKTAAKGLYARTGYNEEKWHWSYLPLAKPMFVDAKKHLSDEKITGFSGSETAPDIQVVKKYVLGIDACCR